MVADGSPVMMAILSPRCRSCWSRICRSRIASLEKECRVWPGAPTTCRRGLHARARRSQPRPMRPCPGRGAAVHVPEGDGAGTEWRPAATGRAGLAAAETAAVRLSTYSQTHAAIISATQNGAAMSSPRESPLRPAKGPARPGGESSSACSGNVASASSKGPHRLAPATGARSGGRSLSPDSWSVSWQPGREAVVPLAVESSWLEVERGHFGIGGLNTLLVRSGVAATGAAEAGPGAGVGDQLDDDLTAGQRFATPVQGGQGKQAMPDAGPLAGGGRQPADKAMAIRSSATGIAGSPAVRKAVISARMCSNQALRAGMLVSGTCTGGD